VKCETEEAHAISLTKGHERDLRHVPSPSVSKSAPRCLRNSDHASYALARKTEQEAKTMSMIVHFNQW